MSTNRPDRGGRKARNETLKPPDQRPREADADLDPDVIESIVQPGNEAYEIGSLGEPAHAPGDFGRDIGDEVDLWI